MIVKLKKNINGKDNSTYQGISLDKKKKYYVISIRVRKENNSKTFYTIIHDRYHFNLFPANMFEIIDHSIDNDWIVRESENLYEFLPEVISYESFWEDLCDWDIEAERKFYRRFIGKIYPDGTHGGEYFEDYQDPKIKLTAEYLGENWVICPECQEAFEVNCKQGTLTCTNIACKVKMNNPCAKEFPI